MLLIGIFLKSYKKTDTKGINLLELVPSRISKWKDNDEGHVTLILPKFKSKLGKIFASKFKNPMYEVKLDAVGAFVWRECDGKNNIYEISQGMLKEFGNEIEPVYERIKLFIDMLKNLHAIELN